MRCALLDVRCALFVVVVVYCSLSLVACCMLCVVGSLCVFAFFVDS